MKATLGHFEIPARDPRRAGEFFARVFGWRAEEVEWEGAAYLKLRSAAGASGGIQGGVLETTAAGFDHPLPVIHVEDASIEDCLARVEAAGGTTVEPAHRVGTMGRFARFRDPDGHEWGLWAGGG